MINRFHCPVAGRVSLCNEIHGNVYAIESARYFSCTFHDSSHSVNDMVGRYHYRPGPPPGSRSMSKIGTWFLIVHVNSLDRKCSKVNHSSSPFGENGLF